ncbi:MAG: rod shape-determining protein MreC [Alphaproteobacteria bacterium]|nr:rod shape-determining protein MreC [Alphaproteobacteria bacterium]
MVRQKVLLIKVGELKDLFRKLFVVILFLTAFLFIMLSRFDSVAIEALNKVVIKVTGPVMQVVELPARVIHHVWTYFYDISHIYAENQLLRDENKQMMILQNKVRTLEVENQLLSRLLNYVPPAEASFMSAQVVAESGDKFTHLLLIYVGNEAVKKGQIVMGDESVIGRIDTVSPPYAKVILITDINSKIPVVVERTRVRGILSGNNKDLPQLIFMRSTTDVQEGDIVVTSGVGGMFPAGLPIGFISSINGNRVEVEPMADLSRVEYVRIVDYGLAPDAELSVDFVESEQNAR